MSSAVAAADLKSEYTKIDAVTWILGIWTGKWTDIVKLAWTNHLSANGIETVGDLMLCSDEDLKELFPMMGPRLHVMHGLRRLREGLSKKDAGDKSPAPKTKTKARPDRSRSPPSPPPGPALPPPVPMSRGR